MNKILQIEIVSDVSCPWCVVGYLSLARAIEIMKPQIEVSISWRPFELNPSMAAEGEDLLQHLQKKYGAAIEELHKTQDMITQRGEKLGFRFDFANARRIYNTFDAHRLLYWARKFRQQTALKLAFFSMYFSEGKDPSKHANLLKAVQNAGLPEAEAREVLETGKYASETRAEEQHYLGMGIQAVPTFIFDGKRKVVGGMPVEDFVALLQSIAAEENLPGGNQIG